MELYILPISNSQANGLPLTYLRRKMERRSLTKRETEVVRLVSQGHKNREVAEKLGISVKTVETHRSNVMNKLALRNVVELIRYAIQKGLIRIEREA
jgi:DNA-binding NarL/FixJ family response regulator